MAQQDRPLAAAMDPFLLFVPPQAAPGCYSLELVVYDPATLQPIADVAGKNAAVAAAIAVGTTAEPPHGACAAQ